MPKPIRPLIRNQGRAVLCKPCPAVCAHAPSTTVAIRMRQKFAVTPPTAVVVRCAHTAEMENRIVVRKAGNIEESRIVEPLNRYIVELYGALTARAAIQRFYDSTIQRLNVSSTRDHDEISAFAD